MEQLYIDLRDHIKARMADTVRMIDEDYGQPEACANGNDQYPIDTPCVLIGTPEVEWTNVKTKDSDSQLGKATFTVRLAFDCYDDTHAGAPDNGDPARRAEAFGRLHRSIHGWMFSGCVTPCIRTASRAYTVGRLKIYEATYRTEMDD